VVAPSCSRCITTASGWPPSSRSGAARAAVQPPAVAARPGVGAFGRRLLGQHVRHHAGRGHSGGSGAASNSAARSRSISAVSRSAVAKARLATTRRRKATLVQAHDVRVAQRRVQPRQRLRAVSPQTMSLAIIES
jgi:hypothetical protein